MPPPVFDSVLSLVGPHLPASERQRLGEMLGIPAWSTPPASDIMQLVERFLDATFVSFDAETASTLVSAEFVAHPWAPLGIPCGPTGLTVVISALRTAFSEVSVTIQDTLRDGDRVAMRYLYEGRHTGDLFGIGPTGRRFQLTGIAVLRISGGRVAEYWREEDMLGLQRQLGARWP